MRLDLACGPQSAKPCFRKLRGVLICPMNHASSRMTGNTWPLPLGSNERGSCGSRQRLPPPTDRIESCLQNEVLEATKSGLLPYSSP